MFAAAIAATGLIAAAGDLNPPAGPVAGTMKTLTEVEPRIAINATNTPGDVNSLFKITQLGPYSLTVDITRVVGPTLNRDVQVTPVNNGFSVLSFLGFTDFNANGSC
jgi:hypothetical protein